MSRSFDDVTDEELSSLVDLRMTQGWSEEDIRLLRGARLYVPQLREKINEICHRIREVVEALEIYGISEAVVLPWEG